MNKKQGSRVRGFEGSSEGREVVSGKSAGRRHLKGSSGFTLLEVLVALALLGIAITAVLQIFSADMKTVSVSEGLVAASLEARSKMREVLDQSELPESSWSGVTDNGFRYAVSVAEALTERTEVLQWRMLEIEVKVFWSQGSRDRSLSLKSAKLIKKQV